MEASSLQKSEIPCIADHDADSERILVLGDGEFIKVLKALLGEVASTTSALLREGRQRMTDRRLGGSSPLSLSGWRKTQQLKPVLSNLIVKRPVNQV